MSEHGEEAQGPSRRKEPWVSVSRRAVLRNVGVGVPVTVAGCLGSSSPDTTCPDTGMAVETPDGNSQCVTPIESERSITDYYRYNRGSTDSSNTPGGFEMEDTTVTFLYRDTEADMLFLVFLNGNAEEFSNAGGGDALMTFKGVTGARWHVQDGRPGQGRGDTDTYGTPEGAFGDTESVTWGWVDGRNDGGAFGALGDDFDVEIVHKAERVVRGQEKQRNGLNGWVFIDGRDPQNPIELSSFDEDTGDVSVGVFSTGGA